MGMHPSILPKAAGASISESTTARRKDGSHMSSAAREIPSCAVCGKEEKMGLHLLLCGKCEVERYCSSDCQKAGWPVRIISVLCCCFFWLARGPRSRERGVWGGLYVRVYHFFRERGFFFLERVQALLQRSLSENGWLVSMCICVCVYLCMEVCI